MSNKIPKVEPISMHRGPNCRIIENSVKIHGKDTFFKMCKNCCMEVYEGHILIDEDYEIQNLKMLPYYDDDDDMGF